MIITFKKRQKLHKRIEKTEKIKMEKGKTVLKIKEYRRMMNVVYRKGGI